MGFREFDVRSTCIKAIAACIGGGREYLERSGAPNLRVMCGLYREEIVTSDVHDEEYRAALKRPLHTLKGGARMAGITAMGDLSHELETLVMQVDNGTVATDDAMFDVIQASLDDLARMREAVANGRRVSTARAMIARIHSLSKPRGAGAPSSGAAPSTPRSRSR